MRMFNDNTLSIGGTPLVRLNRVIGNRNVTVLGKIEARNPAASVKCRIAAGMIWDAEERGALRPGMEIVEPTSGNTGIGLAFVAAARGYRLSVTMPETMSIERRKLVAAFGGNVILTPGEKGMKGAIEKADEIVAAGKGKYFMPQQFKNPANPAIHEKTTGPEIWADTDGGIDVLVAGVGTGGTITGISRYVKQTMGKRIVSVAVEPDESPVISQKLAGRELAPGPHKIQGIGAGFIPDTLDLAMIDRVERITGGEAIETALRVIREEGIPVGISCGAAVAAARRIVASGEFDGKTVVVILPDAAERYLSSPLFEGVL